MRARAALRWLGGGLLFAFVPVTLGIGAFAPASWRAELAEGGIPCPFRLLTGVVCPFCGLTHATLSLGHGELAAGLAAHPLAPLWLLLMAAGAIYIIRGKTPQFRGRPLRPAILVGFIAVAWAFNLAYQFHAQG